MLQAYHTNFTSINLFRKKITDPNHLKGSIDFYYFFPLMFIFLQGEEIFLDMFEDEYRSMMVSSLTKRIKVFLFVTSLLLSVITWWYSNTSCFWCERKPLSIWHLLDKEWLLHPTFILLPLTKHFFPGFSWFL